MVLEHIQKLLFDHDCVIMPDFGGLITHYQPVKIHPVRHTFSPPTKRVAFNEKLKLNDGLLISTLAYDNKLSTEEAHRQVTQFVHELQRELIGSRRFDLKGIGIFRLNDENKIIFEYLENENYLNDAFGLPELLSKPVVATEPVILRTLLKEHVPVKAGFRGAIRRYYRAATALVIGGVVVTGLYLLSLQTNYNASAINPIILFQPASQPEATTKESALKKPEKENSIVEVQQATVSDSDDNAKLKADSSILVASGEANDIPDNENTTPDITSELAGSEPVKNSVTKKEQGVTNPKRLTIAPGEAVLISAKASPAKSSSVKVNPEPPSESKEIKRNFTVDEINAALAKDNTKIKPESISSNKTERATKANPANTSSSAKGAGRTKKPVNTPKPTTPPTIKPKAERFYVIVNGYSTYANAERNRKIIAKKGRPGQIIAPFGDAKLYRIAIAEYDTRDQAIQNLAALKNKYGNTIWILKR